MSTVVIFLSAVNRYISELLKTLIYSFNNSTHLLITTCLSGSALSQHPLFCQHMATEFLEDTATVPSSFIDGDLRLSLMTLP